MASFCEEFSLCSLAAAAALPQAPLGLEPDADRVLLTERGRTVTLYQVSDQKPLGCWSVKQGQTITCPAVCNSETGEFVIVHDDKVLQIWKEDDTNLDKVFKATLSADVYRIHSLPHTEPLVLFKCGAVKSLDALLAAPQQEIENIVSDEVIRWSNAFMGVEQPILTFITEQNGNYFVYIHQCNKCVLQKFKLEPGSESSTPLSFAGYLNNKIVTLFCLYSNGCVFKVLVPLSQSDSEEEQVLSKSLLVRLVISGSILKGTSIVILDKDHIAVAGYLDVPDSNVKDYFSIWNITFQTLQASKELPQGTTGQCWCYGDKLFVTHGKEIRVILYKCETSSLAAAVGKIKDMQTSGMKPISVNWNALQEDDVIGVQPEQPPPAKRQLRSRKSTQLETLTAEQLLLIIKDSSENIVEDKVMAFLSSTQTPEFQASVGYIVSALVNRCKADSSFFPHECLVQLVQTQGLSYSLCPDLMAVALEKTDVHLLQLCLQQFPDIPEAVICACLRTFLSIGDDRLEATNVNLDSLACCVRNVHNNKLEKQSKVMQNGFSSEPLEEDGCEAQLTEKSCETEKKEMCPVGPRKAALLNTILCSAYSETFLLPHLKDLSAEQVILFLQYLQYLYMKCSVEATTDFSGIFSVTINQIMDWIYLLLDAHFTVVVMLPETRRLLSTLHTFVRAQARFYSDLNKIEGSLKELQRIHRPKDVGLYSIEVIKLI
ncbi:nucleolar protein 11 [Sceloporus undulatus]|uniref:nucleolar protein 11 n=1 Tax=Sceloporus undulatus TaxID=8520 RepID=UPI001C4B8891|nr:nucleolar protein 11 [Sceloporus undulatus]